MLDMDKGARRWLYKVCHKQFWRVSGWYEFDDLVQDGFMKFYHVRAHYPKVKDHPHLMALFKVAFLNHIHLLASRRTNSVEVCFLKDLAAGRLVDSLLPTEDSYALLFTAICNAPKPVLRLLEKIARDPSLPGLSGAYRRRRDGTKETLNARLCRMVKLDPRTIDLPSMLKETLAA
jgi:hypothetical protein